MQPQEPCKKEQAHVDVWVFSCQARNINCVDLTEHDEKNLKPNSAPLVSATVNHFPPVHPSAG